MHDADNLVFIVFMGIATPLVLVPLPKVLASGNVGTSMLIIWTELLCVVMFANAIRWNGNIRNWAPIWCDLCNYFFIVADVALAASGLCINRRLYLIVTMDPRRQQRVFVMVVDIILCLVMPWLAIALQYVVQQYRFFIIEDVGCYPGVGPVTLAFPLVWMLPLLLGVVSAGYACFTIRERVRRKHGVGGETGTSTAWNRRVMIVAMVTAVYGVIPTSLCLILKATSGVAPWPGWRIVHSTAHIIIYVPALEWQSSPTEIASVELRRWTAVSLALIIFFVLGLTTDVKRMYWASLRSAIDSVGQTSTGSRSLPERNADGTMSDLEALRSQSYRSGQDHVVSFGKARTEESIGLTDMPKLDSDPEDFKLALATPLPDSDATQDSSWKAHFERVEHSDPHVTKSLDPFDQIPQKV